MGGQQIGRSNTKVSNDSGKLPKGVSKRAKRKARLSGGEALGTDVRHDHSVNSLNMSSLSNGPDEH
mgnify:CR=1 FL=1